MRPTATEQPWSPWATFMAALHPARTAERPYLELAALGEQIVRTDSTAWCGMVREWVRRFGPLGNGSDGPMESGRWSPSAESVWRFREGAVTFAECLGNLAGDTDESRNSGERQLEAFTQSAHPRLTWNAVETKWERQWVAPSLLTAFAVMVVEDLAAGRQLRRCADCHRLFLAGTHESTYCSMRCRRRAQQRRFRAEGRIGSGQAKFPNRTTSTSSAVPARRTQP
jgi:hypothetical protein